MATGLYNFAKMNGEIPSATNMRFGIVVATWNSNVTERLLEGAIAGLIKAGCLESNISVKYVPGTVELTLGAQFFAEYTDVDAVIVLGCVIQGDTRHFDFVCQSVTQGVTQLMISWNMPIAFGVLTTDNLEQAMDRAGGKLGNKGEEAAATAIQMVALQNEMDLAAEANGVHRESAPTTNTPPARDGGHNNKVN